MKLIHKYSTMLGKPESYCSCCGAPRINKICTHDDSCTWTTEDEQRHQDELKQQETIDLVGKLCLRI